jgi:hypothetical protein
MKPSKRETGLVDTQVQYTVAGKEQEVYFAVAEIEAMIRKNLHTKATIPEGMKLHKISVYQLNPDIEYSNDFKCTLTFVSADLPE